MLVCFCVESYEDYGFDVVMILQVIVELSREQVFHQHSFITAPTHTNQMF